jgi:hypothetical protein
MAKPPREHAYQPCKQPQGRAASTHLSISADPHACRFPILALLRFKRGPDGHVLISEQLDHHSAYMLVALWAPLSLTLFRWAARPAVANRVLCTRSRIVLPAARHHAGNRQLSHA